MEISQKEFERLCDTYDEFQLIYKRDYIQKRRKDFLYYLNENNFLNSIRKANLSKVEIDKWLKQGEKDFELGHDSALSEFYKNTLEKLMKHYINYRKNALSKKEAAHKINQSPKTIDQWMRRDDFEIFTDFQKECQSITVDVMVNAIKKGLTLKQAASLGDMSLNNLMKLIKSGEDGEDEYVKLYEVYQNRYIPKQLDVFLEKIKNSKYKKALKSAHLTEDELNKFYIKGLQSIATFKSFTDEYFEFKLENYAKEVIQKGKSPSKAARNVNFIDEDFKYRHSQIDDAIVERQLKIVLPMIRDSIHAKFAAKEINVDVEVLFNWYIKGYNEEEKFKEFSECYWENRMELGIEDFQSLFDKGISEKFFMKYIIRKSVVPEYKFWKSLNLFTYTNEILSDEEQFKIIKENIFDVKENIQMILDAIDEDSDLDIPIEELIEDIEDVDIKHMVERRLKKDDENE